MSEKIAVITEKKVGQTRTFSTSSEIKNKENYKKGDEAEVISGQFIDLKDPLISTSER